MISPVDVKLIEPPTVVVARSPPPVTSCPRGWMKFGLMTAKMSTPEFGWATLIVLATSTRLAATTAEIASRMEEIERPTIATWTEAAVSVTGRRVEVMRTA